MRMVDLIEKKRDGGTFSRGEIRYIINGYVGGKIPDYQMSAWAMTVFYSGMANEEIAELTMAMAESGEQLQLSSSDKLFVDKHSTGGVGDKTTLIVVPIVASCGVPVAKMSGRGLGNTGGTIDKLEAIPGFNVELSVNEFISQVNRIGMSVISQTGNMVPADKKLYALRDVTATVNSIPLIASSIMSKKIAAGAKGIVLDVKYGSGAFMPDENKAEELARTMVGIGKNLGRNTVALISDMSQPLGRAVGNSLEILEVIDTLQGNGPKDLLEVCIELASWMLIVGGKANNIEEAEKLVNDSLANGKAWRKFLEFVSAQNGDIKIIEGKKLKLAPIEELIRSKENGFISKIDAGKIGKLAMVMGAGRETKESIIDFGAGVYILKKPGEKVTIGEPVLKLYSTDHQRIAMGRNLAEGAFAIGKSPLNFSKMVSKVIF